jgi:hypothetical protein
MHVSSGLFYDAAMKKRRRETNADIRDDKVQETERLPVNFGLILQEILAPRM